MRNECGIGVGAVAGIEESGFDTADLGLAAFLVARGPPLCDVGGTNGGRRTFRFAANAQEDVRGFYTGALVAARAYANALRDLKTLIREH